ncbi:MAG: gamma-glutamylcyclotransferase [Pleurocapsa sp.]
MKSKLSNVAVFVYGTLKPGEANYAAYCGTKVVSQVTAYTRGSLYALPMGYPAMSKGESKVYGFLLTFDDSSILASLDQLEGYHEQRTPDLNEYERQLTLVYNHSDRPIGLAWAYYMTTTKIKQQRGKKVSSGCWTRSLNIFQNSS